MQLIVYMFWDINEKLSDFKIDLTNNIKNVIVYQNIGQVLFMKNLQFVKLNRDDD